MKNRLDGQDLCSMFTVATALFERNVDGINALNVFPVPDGDTGTNMFLTLQAVVERALSVRGDSVSDVAEAMADGALMGARGNSGVILSQFFKGIAVGLNNEHDCGPSELAGALVSAREQSYKAVSNPVEGTLLTVISSVAEAAEESVGSDVNLCAFFDNILNAAKDSVAKTPNKLAVLREAGVVDAGGQGLAVIIEGLAKWVRDEETTPYVIEAPSAIDGAEYSGEVSERFLASIAGVEYGYCTQFVIVGTDLDLDTIRNEMDQLAKSTVVVGDSNLAKVHVHTEDPGSVLSDAIVYGTLGQINIQNMDEQRTQFGVGQEITSVPEDVSLTVVAVASGEGLEGLFRSMGASRLVVDGDTMNPSVQDFLDAIDDAPSKNIIVLPNNRNLVASAEQAADISDKEVAVISSKSIPQGVAAILALNTEESLGQNKITMNEAIGSVRTGEVTEAVRSAKLNAVSVKSGQLIGLLEHELTVTGTNLEQVVLALLDKAGVNDGDLVTLYWGDRVSE
ncbi:MAG TPA: DAK2 domain-containing protein, partial [Gemmatimonadetes bacterium]|nr:DAK2 domain-containing protein [Gemmatimonadota bacterium]